MPTDDTIGVKRGPAVFGGELNWTDILEIDSTSSTSSTTTTDSRIKKKCSGWVMDNRSSYVANRATGVLKSMFALLLFFFKLYCHSKESVENINKISLLSFLLHMIECRHVFNCIISTKRKGARHR